MAGGTTRKSSHRPTHSDQPATPRKRLGGLVRRLGRGRLAAAILVLLLLSGRSAPASAQVYRALPGAGPGEICAPEILPVPGTSSRSIAPRTVLETVCVEAPPVAALPVPGGQAPTAQGRQASGVDWGVNRDGWQLTITNGRSDFLLRGIQEPFDNIASAPNGIAPGSEAVIRGTRSIFGGPANMNIRYQAYRYVAGRRENVGGLWVRISSDYGSGGCPPIIRCEPNLKLTVTCDQSGEVRCMVVQAVLNKPVLVRVGP